MAFIFIMSLDQLSEHSGTDASKAGEAAGRMCHEGNQHSSTGRQPATVGRCTGKRGCPQLNHRGRHNNAGELPGTLRLCIRNSSCAAELLGNQLTYLPRLKVVKRRADKLRWALGSSPLLQRISSPARSIHSRTQAQAGFSSANRAHSSLQLRSHFKA